MIKGELKGTEISDNKKKWKWEKERKVRMNTVIELLFIKKGGSDKGRKTLIRKTQGIGIVNWWK